MANKQQINLVTRKFTDRLSDPDNPRDMYVAALQKHTLIVGDKLIQNVVNHSNQKYAQVVTILTALPNAISDYLSAGHAVQIKDLCTLKPKMRVSAKDTAAECTVDTIKSAGISAYPIGKTRELVKKWLFRMTNKLVDITGAGNSGSGSGSASPSTVNVVFQFANGRQQVLTGVPGTALTVPQNTGADYRWSPMPPTVFPKNSRAFREVDEAETRVWIDFVFEDGSEERVIGHEGETVQKPENTEGYRWPATVPETFGSENLTFTEVEDTEPVTYRIEFEFENGEQDAHDYEVGATINYPEPTTGYHWPEDRPRVMPARNVTVTEVRDASSNYDDDAGF